MAIWEREETYVHTITFRDDAGDLYYPSSVSLTIESPCGTVLVDAQSMTSNAAGVYSYGYLISDDATFGEYHVSVKSEYSSATSIDVDKFFVMPWNIVDEIRTYSQQGTKKISDDDLSLIAWNAYRETFFRVLELHHKEKLCCCIDGACSCCGNIECACGTASPICDRWKLKHGLIMVDEENTVYGCDCDDLDEICVTWVNEDSECSNGKVEVKNRECGEIIVYQYDGVTAIPANNQGIFVTYYTFWKSFSMQKFKKAVIYLAAYEVAVITNLTSKKVAGCDEMGKVSFTQRLWDRYIRLIEGISRPMIVGGR